MTVGMWASKDGVGYWATGDGAPAQATQAELKDLFNKAVCVEIERIQRASRDDGIERRP